VVLTAAEGIAGVWLSVETDAPPGATIAVLAGGAFVLSAVLKLATTHRAIATAAALALLVGAAGCGSDAGGNTPPGVLPVTATTTHVADLTRAVGGDCVDVNQLLEPNTGANADAMVRGFTGGRRGCAIAGIG
jgi:hypothetical protein